jgi:N utilization substance protein A
MEVIVNDDQLSLAIGKRGQNVRLATKLVGWNIDIRSEEEIKKQVSASLGEMIASGSEVPLTALESVSAATAATLADRGIDSIEALAAVGVDELSEMLDASLDEAQAMQAEAQAALEAAQASANAEPTEGDMGEDTQEITEQHAVSTELDPSVDPGEVEPNEAMIAAGYDEAVRDGEPFRADEEQLATETVEPVALTEVEQMSSDELVLQGASRDLRPDTITPAPDITSSDAAIVENAGAVVDDTRLAGDEEDADDATISPTADFAPEASAPEATGTVEAGTPVNETDGDRS